MLGAENNGTLKVLGDEDSTLIFLIMRFSTESLKRDSFPKKKKKKKKLLETCFTLTSDLQVLGTRLSHPGMRLP